MGTFIPSEPRARLALKLVFHSSSGSAPHVGVQIKEHPVPGPTVAERKLGSGSPECITVPNSEAWRPEPSRRRLEKFCLSHMVIPLRPLKEEDDSSYPSSLSKAPSLPLVLLLPARISSFTTREPDWWDPGSPHVH